MQNTSLHFIIIIMQIIKCDQKHTIMSFHTIFLVQDFVHVGSYFKRLFGANLSFGSDIAARASRAHAHMHIVHMHVCISCTLTEMI